MITQPSWKFCSSTLTECARAANRFSCHVDGRDITHSCLLCSFLRVNNGAAKPKDVFCLFVCSFSVQPRFVPSARLMVVDKAQNTNQLTNSLLYTQLMSRQKLCTSTACQATSLRELIANSVAARKQRWWWWWWWLFPRVRGFGGKCSTFHSPHARCFVLFFF